MSTSLLVCNYFTVGIGRGIRTGRQIVIWRPVRAPRPIPTVRIHNLGCEHEDRWSRKFFCMTAAIVHWCLSWPAVSILLADLYQVLKAQVKYQKCKYEYRYNCTSTQVTSTGTYNSRSSTTQVLEHGQWDSTYHWHTNRPIDWVLQYGKIAKFLKQWRWWYVGRILTRLLLTQFKVLNPGIRKKQKKII